MIGVKFNPKLPLRFVRYVRMSSELQNARSPDQQFDEIDRQLQRNGHPWIHVSDFRDDAISGRLMRKRPDFTSMIEGIKTGSLQVDLIVVDTIERFGRMNELQSLRYELQVKYGVLVVTADSQFSDPTSAAGKALGVVENIRATTHGDALAHNVLRGKLDAADQKQWVGGPAPCGFRLQSVMKPSTEPAEVAYRKLVPDPATAPVIREYFRLAHEKGFGGGRIAKSLNSDPDWVAKHGKVAASTVDYHLADPIHKGTLRFNRFQTGIADDRRVAIRNDESDVLYVVDYCESIVDPFVFDAVQEMRRVRSEQIRAARAANQPSNGKQIKPVAPGVVVKYPLTGLVRCGVCGGSMRPNSSRYGRYKYSYYYCPCLSDGRCTNSQRVRIDWLWSVFVARLREQLFPLSANGVGDAPPWLGDLMPDIRSELLRRAEQKQNTRPMLERELADLAAKIAGWTQSLAKPDLSAAIRAHVEQEFNAALSRKQKLEVDLTGLAHEVERADKVLNVEGVIDRLLRLSELLGNANPTALNIELSRHVEQILVHPDGRVTMRTHRLGAFEGVTELLAIPAGQAPNRSLNAAGATGNGIVQPRKALLARHDTSGSVINGTGGAPRVDLSFTKLPDRWVDEHVVQIPKRHTFAHLRANDVANKKQETGWSNAKLAEHFGVTGPTIRHALEIANRCKSPGDSDP